MPFLRKSAATLAFCSGVTGDQKNIKNARKTYTFCFAYTKTYTYVNRCVNADYRIVV